MIFKQFAMSNPKISPKSRFNQKKNSPLFSLLSYFLFYRNRNNQRLTVKLFL